MNTTNGYSQRIKMKLQLSKIGLVTAGVLALTLTGLPTAVGASNKGHVEAETSEAQTTDDNTKVSTAATDDSTMSTTSVSDDTATSAHKGKSESKKAAASQKAADAKLKACEKHKTVITNTMKRISDRGQKQLDLFTTIATRTETFYTDKGKTLSNYDALVADVDAKKAAAQAVVTSIAEASTSFSCDGTTDAKTKVNGFKESLKSETAALKEYKTAVKNLIVGVKSVQSTVNTDDTTGGDQ